MDVRESSAVAWWHPARLRTVQRRQPPTDLAGIAGASASAEPALRRADEQATRAAAFGFALVAALHVWILSAGGASLFPSYSSYYDRLAGGFLRGQTSLTIMPAPAHLALPDPYDPVANRPFRQRPGVHDAVLFDGKFFLYWGPVPALLLAPLKWVSGLQGIGDENLVLLFSLGTMLLTALTLRRLWGRFFPEQPPWTLFVAILLAGVATPMGYFLARPAVYEAAILGGQFFLLAGLYALCGAGPFSTRRLAVAGVCWALAVGSRVSLAVAVSVLAAVVAWQVVRDAWRAERRIPFGRLLAFGMPLLAGALSLAAYNHVRFGTPFEFGQRYQLTSANYKSTPALFSPGNLWPGVYSYALRPVRVHAQFPFLEAVGGEGTFPSFTRIPEHYEFNEPIAGLLLVTPFLWLAALPVFRLLARAPSPGIPGEGGGGGLTSEAGLLNPLPDRPPEYRGREAHPGTEENRAVLYFLTASLLGFAPVLFMVGSTMRYLADLTPCLLIVAAIGMWQRGRRLADHPRDRRRFSRTVVALAAYSVAVGLLLSFSGYYDHFFTRNHKWFGRLSYRTNSPAWYTPRQNSSAPPAASEPDQRNAAAPDANAAAD